MSTGDEPVGATRRSFLISGGAVLGAWIAANWPAIAAAHAHAHAQRADAPDAGPEFEFLNSADAADVEAMADLIVPGGATPGAREARALRFLDRALASFFSGWSAEFRLGLSEFQAAFRRSGSPSASFAAAAADERLAFLQANDRSAFFESVRFLTVLGMFSSPRYGGNFDAAGWRLLGFEDRHAFAPPFGDYDRDYAGFALYPDKPA